MGRKRVSCECLKCHKCKDRLRRRRIKAGTHIPYKGVGRQRDLDIARRKDKKLMKTCFKAWRGRYLALKWVKKRDQRRRRDHLFKANVKKFGSLKAKLIAVCVRKRQ